ncbi:MAG TPA: cupin domain-containing protein [Gemmatimonadaceae bacterium]
MSLPNDRLRPPPSERFAGPEHRLELDAALEALRSEPHDGKDRHRQITVFRKGPLRLVLFAFEAGGSLASHRAPGYIVIHVLRGRIRVQTLNQSYELATNQILMLDPEVVHDVQADEQTDMLLTVSLAP